MIVQVVGKQEMSFETKDGSHIDGTNLFALTSNPNVDGFEAIKVFVPRTIDIPKGLEINKKANIDFNHKGKIVGISLVQ